MKHKEFRNRVAYARRFGKLEVENVVMKERIHRLVRDNNRVVKKLRNLEEKHKEVLLELDKIVCKEGRKTEAARQ